jgi:hypothetical protein
MRSRATEICSSTTAVVQFSSVFFSSMLLAPVALGVVSVYPALVPETFVALRELILVDVLEEPFGVVGEPHPRAEEAQADYARLASP